MLPWGQGRGPYQWEGQRGNASLPLGGLGCAVLGNAWILLLPTWRSGKEFTCNAGDLGLIPRLGKPPRLKNGNPLQYSCLGNPMDREAWPATVHGVAKSQTWPSTSTGLWEHGIQQLLTRFLSSIYSCWWGGKWWSPEIRGFKWSICRSWFFSCLQWRFFLDLVLKRLVLWGLRDRRVKSQLSLYSLSNWNINCFENKTFFSKDSKVLKFCS